MTTGEGTGGAQGAPPPSDELLDAFLRLPRVAGLALSPDGRRLVTTAALPDGHATRFVSALWEIDPRGTRPARRLTRSAAGESSPAFLCDGSLLFTSGRSDPAARGPRHPDRERPAHDEDAPGLWLLPAGGGEASPVAQPPGGVEAVATARQARVAVLAVPVMPAAPDLDDDRRRAEIRDRHGVTAQLYEVSAPIRHWDRWLGPRHRRLFAADIPGEPAQLAREAAPQAREAALRDLTPRAGHALLDCEVALSPDGATAVATWWNGMGEVVDLVAVDTATGSLRLLATGEGRHSAPSVSPDGRLAACIRGTNGRPGRPGDARVWLVELATAGGREVSLPDSAWPRQVVFTPDSSAVLVVADQDGRMPIFRVELDAGTVTRLTAEGAYTDVCVSPDGARVYALRSDPWCPPHPVALDARVADQRPSPLPGPPGAPLFDDLATTTTQRIELTVDGSRRLAGWLTLPVTAGPDRPVPLVLLIHGGPVASFAGWSWRQNPRILAARGHAVAALDPSLSTGYGREHVARSWTRWADIPYAELLEAVDLLARRDDIDGARLAALGGSYGGFMANWMAGHTDRFRCLVTHASVWSLRRMADTSDESALIDEEFGSPHDPEGRARLEENSPDLHAGPMSAPMLVIHGGEDARCPISEALHLVADLRRRGVPARFLHFPDEAHWILKPANVRVWFATVLGFLDEHLRGIPFEPHGLL